MERPPRENNSNLFSNGVGYRILYQALLQTVIILLEFSIVYKLTHNNALASTMTFLTLNFMQVLHSANLKTNRSIFKYKNLFKNKTFNISFIVAMVLVLGVTLIPGVGQIFGLTTLSFNQFLVAISCACLVVPLVELGKFVEYLIKPERIR